MKTKNLRHSIGGVSFYRGLRRPLQQQSCWSLPLSLASRAMGIVITGLFLVAIGCSDGELAPQERGDLGIVPPIPPTINSLTAEPDIVDFGGSTTLTWDVDGADKIEITSSGATTNFSFASEEEFKSSTVVSDLQETTTFILTATKMPGPAEEALEGEEGTQGQSAKQALAPAPEEGGEEGAEGEETPPIEPAISILTVQVTVRGGGALSIERFEAEDTTVRAGDKTVLHWNVLPAEAQVSITSSTGEIPVVGDCMASSVEAMEVEGEAALEENMSASGCASVQPMEDTTYILTATLGDQTASQELVVSVSKEPVVEFFTVNGAEEARVDAYPAEVTLAWRARPVGATVMLMAEPPVGNINMEERALTTEESFTITVNQDTKFTLTVSVAGEGEVTAEARVRSELVAMDCSQFIVNAPTSPVLEGERIRISWQLPAQATLVASAEVKDSDGEVYTANGADAGEETPDNMLRTYVEIPAKSGGYSIAFKTAAGAELCPRTVNVPVASLEKTSSDKAIRVVKDIADSEGVYVGLDAGGFNDGKIKVANYNPAAHPMEIDFFEALKGFDDVTETLNATMMESYIKTFPVNAVAKNSAGTLFVATTGVVLYKKAEGDWTALTTLLRTDDNGDYPGEHPSCFGKVQSGKRSSLRGEIVTLGQVCDMVATDDGKLYVATDRGLYSLNNVEGFIEDYHSEQWQGRDSPLYGKVINDVEVVGSDVYAAGSMGVTKNGEPLLEGVTAYSIAAAHGIESEILIVGVDGGVKIFGREGPVWEDESLSSEGAAAMHVYSVVADPYDPRTIYAGTDAGLFVSRNGGATFTDVTPVGEDGSRPVVRSVAAIYSGDPREAASKYCLYLATESGVMKADLSRVRMGAPSTPPVVGPDPDAGQSEVTPPPPSESEIIE